nr:PHP domain-containing protein [Dissulfurirhabdus thermomarina]
MLKADFHLHTAEDPEDLVRYTAEDLIDMARAAGYGVLAITNHNRVTWNERLAAYARDRGIVLIPGMEATIEGRHVLLYNVDPAEVDRSSLEALVRLRREETLVIAPHPFYPSPCALRGRFRANVHLFDAVEYCHFRGRGVDFNRPAQALAARYGLPMVGTSDAHQRVQFHTTYTLVEAEPDAASVIRAVKAGRVRVVSRPLPLATLARIWLRMTWRNKVVRRLSRPRA